MVSRRALATAARLAEVIAAEHGDSFPLRQVAQFSSWSVRQRRSKVTVDSLRRAGNAAMSRSGFPSALRPWRESLRRARAMGDTAGAAAVLGNMGTGFYGDGSLDSAVFYYREAERLAQSVGDRRTALNALGGTANVQRDRGDNRGARRSYDQSLALRAQIGDVRGMAADRNNIGMLAENLGDAAGARASYLTALELATRHAIPEAEAAALVNLGQLASLEADYADALARYARALGIYRSLGYRPDEALVLHSLGLLELRRGNYRAARFRLEEAAVLFRETGPAASIAQVQEDLARTSVAMGNPQSAIDALDRAEAALPADAGGLAAQARLSLARGDLAVELNDYAAADRWYARSESLSRQAGDLVTRAGAQQGRGYLLLLDGSDARAMVVLNQAARALDQSGDRRAAALVRLDVAAAQAEAGEMERARALAGLARDTLRRLGDPAGEAAALGVLASIALQGGRPVAAESLYREGLDLLVARPAPGVTWSLRSGLAQAEVAQGRLAKAAQDLRAAVRDVERSAAFLPSPHARSAFLADKWAVYGTLAQLELARGRDTTAFEVSEQVRSRQFLDELALGPVAWNSGADSGLIRREQDLRRAITELSGQLDDAPAAAGLVRGPDPAAPTPSVKREALARTEAEYAELLTLLRQRQAAYAKVVSARTASWRDVTRRLPEKAAMLEYLVSDSTAILFVVTRGGVRGIDLDVDRRTLTSLVEFVRGTMTRPVRPGTEAASRAPLQRLHQLLIQPAEEAGLLEGMQQLILVPHAELHYLPFAALLGAGEGGRYLVARYDLATVPSASVWLELDQRVAASAEGDRVLAIAPAVVRLPGSRDEVEAIGGLHGERATLLLGAAATRQVLLSALPNYDVLHFATYGVLNRRNPLFSYLELAPSGAEDGRLEVHDIYGLPLHARLVVLSACQTGIGSGLRSDVPAGDEWVGLSRAFLFAGADRVVATLWLVADRASAELMTWFHAGLVSGQDEAAALAAAQRKAIADPRLADPFFWSGFVLAGGL
jgi:CHAT domain-containing protein